MLRKRVRIQNECKENCRTERSRGNHGRTSHRRIQPQTLLYLPDVEVELLPPAHTSSRCVPRWRLATTDSATAAISITSIIHHQRLYALFLSSVAPAPWVAAASVPALPLQSRRTSSEISSNPDSRRSEFTATKASRPFAKRI